MSGEYLPMSAYRGMMSELSDRLCMFEEGVGTPGLAQDTRNLMSNLNPSINPGGNAGLLGRLNLELDKF